MKNVSSVPRLMSSRCCFALNGQTHSLDRQLTDFIECINYFQMVDFACPAILLFSYNEFACPSHCSARQIDAGFHTTNCPLQKSSQQGLWLSRHGQVGLSWPQIQLCHRAVVVSAARSFHCLGVKSFTCVDHLLLDSLAAFFGLGSSHLTTKTTRSGAVCFHHCPNITSTCRYELSTRAARNGVVGIPRNTDIVWHSLFQDSFPRSLLGTRHISAPCAVGNRESSGFSRRPTNTPLVLQSSTLASSASCLRNEQTSRSCTSDMSCSL